MKQGEINVKMKVLQINMVYGTGSTGKIVKDIHKMLQNDGVESYVCYGVGSKNVEINEYKFCYRIERKINYLISRYIGRIGYGTYFSTKRLIKYIDKVNPDIIHLHNIHGYYVDIYSLLRYLHKKKSNVVWTLHDDFIITGRCAGYYLCERWKEGCITCNNLMQYPQSEFFDNSRKQYKKKTHLIKKIEKLMIITPSNWLGNRIKQAAFLEPTKIKVINNGIDLKVFYPRKESKLKERLGIKNEKILLSVIPDFNDSRKGGAYILELAKKFEGENVKIIIVGSNIQNQNLANNIIGVERIESQDLLAEYYSIADIFVITSCCENFPTVCLEALACGTQIVGFDAGGVKETANDSVGRFVQNKNVNELYKECKNALIKEYNIDEACANYAKQRYSKEVMYREYKKIYNHVINKEL